MLHVLIPQTLTREFEFSVSFSAYFMVGFLQYYKLSSPAEILWGKRKKKDIVF